MLEKAFNALLERKKKYEIEVLSSPPKSMEELQYRIGQYNECCTLIADIEDILKGKEDE